MIVEDDLVVKMTAHVVEQIETRLREAYLLSTSARNLLAQGLGDRSVEAILDLEPLLFEAKALLEAITIVRRVRSC